MTCGAATAYYLGYKNGGLRKIAETMREAQNVWILLAEMKCLFLVIISFIVMHQVAFEPGATLMAKKETNAFAVLKHHTLQHIV